MTSTENVSPVKTQKLYMWMWRIVSEAFYFGNYVVITYIVMYDPHHIIISYFISHKLLIIGDTIH